MHPITVFRNYLATHPNLREFSSQRGIGKLIGKSDAYVRGLESKSTPMSAKAANLIEQKTGVDAKWLMLADAAGVAIVCADGTPFTHSKLEERVRAETNANYTAAAAMGGAPLVDELLKLARVRLLDGLNRNDPGLLIKFTQLLADAGAFQASDKDDDD